MNERIRNVKPRFYIGLAILLAETVTVPLVLNPFREQFGLWTTLGVQMIVLAFGVLPPIIFKWDLREVFPFKRPMIRQIFGIIILWFSQLYLGILVNNILNYFFPQISGGIQEIRNLSLSIPLIATFIIMVIMPPVCEELLHRGTIRYTFIGVKNKWIKIAALGLIFGVFHMNLSQFAPTTIVGMFAAYIIIDTENLFLTMLLHIMQNSLSFCVDILKAASGPAAPVQNSQAAPMIGNFLVLCTIIPFLIVWGSKLLHSKEYNREHKLGKRAKWFAAISAAFCFIAGACITIFTSV